jgi:RNA processing factor Prp31
MSRLELKGALADLRQNKVKLALQANTKITAIKSLLSNSAIHQIQELDIEGVASLAEELRELYHEYKDVLDKIRRIEQELE